MSADASFDGLFEAVPDALLLVDGDGRIVQANAQAERLFGYAPGELLGKDVEALIPSAARERHRGYRQHYMARPHVRPMGVSGQSLIGLRPDGTQFPVEIALSPIGGAHGPRYLASVRDISETQRARQALVRARYDALAARIGQLALEAQDESGVVDALPRLLADALDIPAVAVLFVSGDSQSVEIRASVGLDDDAAAPALDEAALLADVGAGETRVVDDFAAAASRFPLRAAAGSGVLVPLFDRGRPMGALLARAPRPRHFDHDALHLLRSVAHLAAAFVQRRRTEEQLAHSQRLDAIGQLTGGIAHDFNNLLTVMSGSLQLLELECADTPEAGELIASALRSAGRGAELTGKLLAFARRQRLSPRAVDVPALLRDVESMLKRTLGDSVHLHVECVAPLAAAYADPSQLEAALLNLALNARDAMPRGGEIAIEARAHEAAARPGGDDDGELAAGDYLRILVADTGRGMAPETLARAMEPFFTTKEAGRGSGLGLSMVYGFAKQSGGDLRIDSALGYGTRVELFLPAARAPAAAPAPPGGAHAPGRGETVLVVEDDAAVRAIALAFLRASGYRAAAVASAGEALRYLAGDGEAAAMFSDVMLGEGMNGKDLAAAARRLRPGLPVVLTSGYETETANAGEAFDLLRKPYRREQVAAAIARAIGPRREGG
ncbi:PAS domain S-box protein [Lysobacter enzymogenes]|uniref:PAS domain S-box protein n=1 Tax=Lysobacter enzymogenes TaxID=69 RepID=UPI001A96805F|nr:PAS domain S-box protein [Lysobacter enzymogenes]QQP95466.1 PAS domain S-box protein [Lysobacter enzymogenes]